MTVSPLAYAPSPIVLTGRTFRKLQSKVVGAQSEARRDDLIRLEKARKDAQVVAEGERAREEALLRAKVDTILARANRHHLRGFPPRSH